LASQARETLAVALSDVVDLSLERQLAELLDRKSKEQADPPVEDEECVTVSTLNVSCSAFNSGGIGNAQMGSHWLPGQTGQTSFAALSQTVKTKSSLGESGFANSSQGLLRAPQGIRADSS
jgi:hypothetical protein